MISRAIVACIVLLMTYSSVESQFHRSSESKRSRFETFSIRRDLHLRRHLENEEKDMRKPSCTSKMNVAGQKYAETLHHNPNHRRLKRQVTTNNSPRDVSPYGTAAHFSGGPESLKYKARTTLPNDQFSVGVWIQPEGGQNVPVNFLGKLELEYTEIFLSTLLMVFDHPAQTLPQALA